MLRSTILLKIQNGARLHSGIALLAAIAYTACALIVGLCDIAFMLQNYTRYPFGDHWGWLARYWERGLWGALLGQYNEHRFFFPGILYWADFRFLGATNTFLTVISIALNIACLAMLALPLIRSKEPPLAVRLVFLGFVTITMLWYIQGPNFFYPYNLCIPFANLDILLSLFLFAIACEREPARGPGKNWILAGSMLCGFAATFTYGHGILIWPLLLLNAFLLRIPVRRWMPIALTAALAIFLYFRHYISPAGHANPIESLRKPAKLASYFVLMIGLPWLGGEGAPLDFRSNIPRYAVILIGLSIAACFIALFLFRGPRSSWQIFYSSLLLLAIGSVAITALSRSNFPLSQALSARYAPIPLIFWISLVALLTIHLCHYESSGGAGRALWCIALAAISMETFPTQFVMGPYMAGRAKSQQAAVVSIALGIPDQEAIGTELSPKTDLLTFVDRRTMEVFHRPSLFHLPETHLLGTTLQSRFFAGTTCQSGMTATRVYENGQNKGVCFSGWLFDRKGGRAADRILITDRQGTIRGFGVGRIPRPDVAQAFGNAAMYPTGWIAYARLPPDGLRQLRVFGVSSGGAEFCEVVSPSTSLPP